MERRYTKFRYRLICMFIPVMLILTYVNLPAGATKAQTERNCVPRIYIKTLYNSPVASRDTYVSCTISTTDCDTEYILKDAKAEIKVRGNSTAEPEKKPYRIRFAEKTAFLGVNDGSKCRNWCLLADWYDVTMLRNYTALTLGKTIYGPEYFTPDCLHVEVYLNGDYRGVYLLTDHVQINKHRVDITENPDGNFTLKTGYLVKSQGGRADDEGTIFITPGKTIVDRFGVSEYVGSLNFQLAGSNYNDSMLSYASKYLTNAYVLVASALYEDTYYGLDRDGNLYLRGFKGNPSKTEKQKITIGDAVNIDSLVKSVILEEIVKEFDGNNSFNVYFDTSASGDARVTFAVPWDYDLSQACVGSIQCQPWSGYFAITIAGSERHNAMLCMMGSADWFMDMVSAKWTELYDEILAGICVVYEEGTSKEAAFTRDYQKWGSPAQNGIRIYLSSPNMSTYWTTHDQTVVYLNNWLVNRVNWLNGEWGR